MIFEAGSKLISSDQPEHSLVGIVLAALSLLVMPIVSLVQRRSGLSLGSQSVVADSKQTLLCTYMSAALLLGLLANSILGWWWADPIAGLVIAALAIREGVSAWRGEGCLPAEFLFTEGDDEHDDDHDENHEEAHRH